METAIRNSLAFVQKYWSFMRNSRRLLSILSLILKQIRKLLVVDPKGRITAEQALSHPWFEGLMVSSFSGRFPLLLFHGKSVK